MSNTGKLTMKEVARPTNVDAYAVSIAPRLRLRIETAIAVLTALCATTPAMGQEVLPEPEELAHAYATQVRPLLQTYCIRCHDQGTASGGLSLDSLDPRITAMSGPIWTEVKNKLDGGTMPPRREEPRPTREEQELLIAWVGGSLKRAAADHRETGGDTLIRRLNHRAYGNIMRTLLGVPAQGTENFPPDVPSDGFDTVGAGLYTTTELYELYLASAKESLDLAITTSPTPPKPYELRTLDRPVRLEFITGPSQKLERIVGELLAHPPREQREALLEEAELQMRYVGWPGRTVAEPIAKFYHAEMPPWGLGPKGIDYLGDDACLDQAVIPALRANLRILATMARTLPEFQPFFSYGGGADGPVGRNAFFSMAEPGYYRIWARLCLTSTADRPLPLTMYVDGHVQKRWMISEPESAPGTYEATVYLTAGQHMVALWPFDRFGFFIDYVNALYGTKHTTGTYHEKPINYVGSSLPQNIMCAEVSASGPILESWPPPAVSRIFTRGVDAPPTREYAEEIVAAFMSRACAGTCAAEDQQPYVELIMSRYETDHDFVAAVKHGLTAVLCSPAFLYIDERQRADPSRRRPLNGCELARRLAYCLWSDLPDEPLIASARSGKLLEDAELLDQCHRMLADARSQAFCEGFVTQWLKIDKLESLAFSRERFPIYDSVLAQSAVAESVGFFSQILDGNLGVMTFIDAGFTVLDGRLASHYGIPGITGNQMRRVILPMGSHRGGVLAQASVLMATGNGQVTSPVRRGAFIMDRLLGVSPGVPPPNVPALDKIPPNADGTLRTPREILALHRQVASCARCHDKIDPLGVGLENYDAFGRWSDTLHLYHASDGKTPQYWEERAADVRGTMLDGAPYDGPEQLRRRLVDHQDQFIRCLAEQLVAYLLGRGLEESDRPVLDGICSRTAANGLGLATLVDQIVLSDLFRSK
jgi:hypothetical protein